MAKLCSPLSTSPRSSFLNDLMSRPCSFIDELSEHLDPYDILDELPSICGDIQKVEDDKNNNEFKYNYDYGCDYNFNSTAISDATDFGSINNYDLYDECDIKPNIMNIKLENDLMWPVLNSSLTTNDCHNTDMPAVPLAAITGRNVAGSQIVQGTGTVSVATAKVTSSANTITDSIVIKQEPIEVNCDSMKNASNGTSVVPLLQQASYNSNMESKIIVKNEILDDGYEQILKQQQQQQQRQQLENLNNIPPGTSLLRKSNVNNQQLTQQQLTQNRKIGTIIMQQQQHQQQQRQLLVIQHHPHGQQQQQQHHRKRDHLLSCSTRLAIIDNCDTSVTAITATTTNTSTTTATATTANLYQRPDTPHSLDDDCSATTSAMETATPTIITTTIIPTEFKHDIDLNTCVMGSNNISLSDSQYIQQVSQELRDINKEQIGTLRTNTDYTLNDILDVINTDVTTASTPALATTALKSQLLRHDYHRNFNINDSPSSSSSSSSSCCSSHNKSKFIIKSPITMNYPSLTINCNNINSKNFLVRQCNADVMLSSVINTNYNNNDDDDDAAAILTPLRTSECDTTDNDDDNDNDNEFYIDYINNNYTNDDEHEHEADADDDDDDYEDNVSICESSTCSILDALNSPLSIVGATNASIVAAGASAVAGPTALTVSANSISPLISASTTKNRLTINSNNMNATRNLTNNVQKQQQQQQQQQQQHLQYNNQQHMDHSYTRMDDISTNLDTPSDSEEEIDVVSINDRKLPTNPSDKDRRALQHKVAHKFSSRIVRSINGVRTIPPRRRGSYELPYTPVSSSPVKSVNNSRYPSPATTPYENQYTRKYVQQQQQLMKGNGSLTNIIVNGETTIATPINVLTEKSRKRLLLNHNQQHQQQQNKQQQQQQLAGTTLLTTTQLRNYKKISNNNNNNTDIITISDSFLHESNTTACNINVKKYRTKKGGANTVLTTNKQQQQQQGNYITGVTSTLKRQYAAIDSETADTIEKRNLHNNMERQRRIGLKNLFDTLKKQIPSIKDKERAPKVTILREATKLCHNLTREDQYLMEEKLRLKENLLLLNRRYNQLKSVMSTAAESEEDIDVGVIMENDYGTFE